jgi:dipeptidyl aminopeptidase/acylaminoacyl peptidase
LLHILHHTRPFALGEIKQKVLIWHGADDTDVPVAAAEALALHLTNCKLHVVPRESHSMIRRHWENVLDEVMQAAANRSKI